MRRIFLFLLAWFGPFPGADDGQAHQAIPVHQGDAATVAPADTSWDVTKPRGQTRTIDFTTDEGTWTSVDVSPDGKWVVFDLLGHIYRVPVTGGEAECLTQESGIAVNYEPRYSPDGNTLQPVSYP